ncbi:helix-turn-helix transcriptional regulator [Nocardioides ultimimeridianus]
MAPPRDALYAELEALIASGCDGPGRLVVLSGEAGIGKTTVVKRLAAGHRGRVLWGSCEPFASTRPLMPLHDWARETVPELAKALAGNSRSDLFTDTLEILTAPTLAVVEDVHWADEATLDLLVYLGRRMAGLRTTLVLTARAIPQQLAGLGERLTVPPLDREEIAALTSDSGLDPEHIHAITGGNAFFVTQLIDAPTAGVPDSVREAVLARLHVLSEAARAVVETVAVAPHCAELRILYGAAGAEPADIEEAERGGLVVCDGRIVTFRHELAREAVETAMPGPRRHQRHADVLAGLVAHHQGRDAAIAYHAHFSDDHPRALHHGLRAARRSIQQGARPEAVIQLERASAHLDHAEPRQAIEILRTYVDSLTALGQYQPAVPLSERAVAVARELGDDDVLAGQLARHAFIVWRRAGTASARRLVEEAWERSRGDREGAGRLAALLAGASLHMLAREIEPSLAMGRAAADLARRRADRDALADALHLLGTASWFADPDQAEPLLEESLELARSMGDDRLAGMVMLNAGSGAGEVRRYREAERWLEECHRFAVAYDLDEIASYARAWAARVALEQGDLADAVARADACAGSADLITRIAADTVRGRARHRLGRPGARSDLDAAWALAEPTGDLQRTWPVVAGYAELDLTDHLAVVFDQAVELHQPWALGELGWQMVRLGLIEPSDARLAGAAPPFAAMIAGDWRQAAERWRALGCRYDQALAEGETSDSELLKAAIARLDALGARADADRIAASLRARDGTSVRRARRSTAAHPFGLTDREAEVAALLREGLTNAEIAERTFTSVKTAGHHVSAILGKVGVASRRDAVAAIWGPASDAGHQAVGPRSEA